MSDYKKLLVWEKAHKLAVDGIRAAVRIRAAHFSSIKSQIIRAAGSIPMNIAEGSGQESRKDFCRFLRYSLNSAYELEYHWLLAKDIEVLSEEDFNKLAPATVEIQKMLRGLLRRLRSSDDEEKLPAPPSV
jgi:four helix bundle protein